MWKTRSGIAIVGASTRKLARSHVQMQLRRLAKDYVGRCPIAVHLA
ncbi:MAG: hypothetical protein ACXVZV_07630 [Terriglobales bacterium]